MNIQKEVDKFETKKAKLANDFVNKMVQLINGKADDNARIEKTIDTLIDEKGRNEKLIGEAQDAIQKA